jgi:hypothetical protein
VRIEAALCSSPDPSLRLKNGYARDDAASYLTVCTNQYDSFGALAIGFRAVGVGMQKLGLTMFARTCYSSLVPRVHPGLLCAVSFAAVRAELALEL